MSPDEQGSPDSEPTPEDEVVIEAEAIVADATVADDGAELVEEDLDQLSLVAKERDEMRELAQRLQADFENYRKRAARQAEDTAARQTAEIVTSLLPVLDAFDLAQAHLAESTDPSDEAAALSQARSLLLDTLTKQGLEAVSGAGEPFDPQVHDAVMHAPADDDHEAAGPIVDEVLRAGWSWRGTVLRPAMVRVKG
ncbi:MAG: nucleotide exchange factor GrpE [Actinomycetes bacterium]